MNSEIFFAANFKALTGHIPMRWQERLFRDHFLTGNLPGSVGIPTGLGKTAVMAVWLIALAWQARNAGVPNLPRRLAYVVNRRTVVDQATQEAVRLRTALLETPELSEVATLLGQLATNYVAGESPIAISTLRGEFADKGEWRFDPARPAIVVGTVDMIGSRLLFSGYGRCGFKSKPLHAGLIGQETLLVHDEAHLEPAFQKLLECITQEQQRSQRIQPRADARPLRVMALSATVRGSETPATETGIAPLLFDPEQETDEARKRLRAPKWLDFHSIGSEKALAAKVAERALKSKESKKAILIYLRRVEDVTAVAELLRGANAQVQTLTGTQRGLERDRLATSDVIYGRFMPEEERSTPSAEGTVYLVSTSAGEVGVNLSADHMVCDLTPLDSMAQRIGRVNRFGNGEARVEVMIVEKAKAASDADNTALADALSSTASNAEPPGKLDDAGTAAAEGKKKAPTPIDLACQQTLKLLRTLLPKSEDSQRRPGRSVSPEALSQLLGRLPPEQRRAAFTPEPVILPATDILFDAWALTTVRGRLPGRPPVADWLHGLTGWEPPETHVAWREEVAVISGPLLYAYPPEDLLEDYPLKPHEQLRDRSCRVFEQLEKVAEREPNLPVWLVGQEDEIQVMTLAALTARGKQKNPMVDIANATVILPPAAGGLTGTGLLDGGQAFAGGEANRYDVADEWGDPNGRARRRIWGEGGKPPGMRLVRRIDLPSEAVAEADDEPELRSWFWYTRPRSADDDGSRGAKRKQELTIHLDWTAKFANKIVEKLGLEDDLARAIVLAARWHDLGKDRGVWQRSIGNPDIRKPLAKSGPDMRPLENLTRYRHEFGSLLDVTGKGEFKKLDRELQELVLHLIAAHHGRARPHFPTEEAFDPERPLHEVQVVAAAVPQRYARLQRRYGRWGLAWLESLVRAADAMASNAIQELTDGTGKEVPT